MLVLLVIPCHQETTEESLPQSDRWPLSCWGPSLLSQAHLNQGMDSLVLKTPYHIAVDVGCELQGSGNPQAGLSLDQHGGEPMLKTHH